MWRVGLPLAAPTVSLRCLAVPVMITSGMLYWLVSQRIFRAVVYDLGDTGARTSVARNAIWCFSFLSMIIVAAMGVGISVTTVSMDQLVYKKRMSLYAGLRYVGGTSSLDAS